MAEHTTKILSTNSVTRITPLGSHSGMDITLQNVNSSGYIYIGGTDDLSSGNFGYRISPNHAISFELPGRDALYAISSIDNMVLAVMQTGLEGNI